jgi:predicted DNA-binding transcriptional regulator YafY
MVIDYLCPIVSPSDIKNTTMPLAKNAFERYKIIDRHLRRNKGLTAKELTEIVNNELYQFERASNPDHSREVSERMIRIDLKKIPEIFPVEIIVRNGRHYYENTEDTIDNINITEQDKTAITLAMGVFARFKGTPLFDQFSDAVTRILASSVLRKINTTDTQKYIQVAEVSDSSGIEWLETIYNAIVEKKTLKLHYKSFGEQPSVRSISPYMLKEYRNKWYMIAYVHDIKKNDKILLHRLSRILNIEESDVEYEYDKSFDGKKYFKYTLGVFHKHGEEPIHVKLKLHGKSIIKLLSEDKVHSTQELVPLSAEEALIDIHVYDSPELRTFILSYSPSIEVIEPKSLRDDIKDKLEKSIGRYNQ